MTHKSLEKIEKKSLNSVVVVRMERINGLAVILSFFQVNCQQFDSMIFISNPAECSAFECYSQKEICIWGKGTESEVRLRLAAA